MRAQAGREYCFHSFINLAQGNIYRRSRVYSLAAAFYAAVSFLHTRRIEIDFDQADGVRLDGHRKINTRSAPFHSLFFNPVSLSLSFPFSLSLPLSLSLSLSPSLSLFQRLIWPTRGKARLQRVIRILSCIWNLHICDFLKKGGTFGSREFSWNSEGIFWRASIVDAVVESQSTTQPYMFLNICLYTVENKNVWTGGGDRYQ